MVSSSKHLIIIAGPTASGKTSVAVEVAKGLDCSIVSADSRQFYKELNIGSAKPSTEEMKGVPHYFVDFETVTNPISAGEFERICLDKLASLFQEKDHVVMVGGSGMFINAVAFGLDPLPHSKEIREKWNTIHQEKGLDYLLEILKVKDVTYYNQVDRSNPVRIIRALEVIDITNTTYSSQRKGKSVKRPFNVHYFVLKHERETLYKRINERVIKMMAEGLWNEAVSLEHFRNFQSLNTVGYKEIFHALDNNLSQAHAIQEIQKNTRRYAKRQLTWFRQVESAIWIKYKNEEKTVLEILKQIKG